jgi:hypothetical protein
MNIQRTKTVLVEQAELDAIQSLRQSRPSDPTEYVRLVKLARSTRSAAIRNAAALALADLRVEGARDVLIALLKRPSTRNHRGTLLHAIEELDTDVPLLLLVDIIAKDGYEAREQALDLIATERSSGTALELQRAQRKLTTLAASGDRDRAGAARAALSYLRGVISAPPVS